MNPPHLHPLSSVASTTEHLGDFLRCRLGPFEYGIKVAGVLKVLRCDVSISEAAAKRLPFEPLDIDGMKAGVIDMRLVVGVPPVFDPFTVTVIVQAQQQLFALVVDDVYDLVGVRASEVTPVSRPDGRPCPRVVIGIASIRLGFTDHHVVLLDPESMVAGLSRGATDPLH